MSEIRMAEVSDQIDRMETIYKNIDARGLVSDAVLSGDILINKAIELGKCI